MSTRHTRHSTRILLILTLLFSTTLAQAIVINEIRIDQPGADSDEYFELYGSAGESLDGLSYLVIGDQGDNQGYIEAVIHLSGHHIAADSFFLVAEASFGLGAAPDRVSSLNFENNDNVTHLLVNNFSGHLYADIDTDDDGLIDNILWDNIVDSVALLSGSPGGDIIYSPYSVMPLAGTAPSHFYRSIDQVGPWQAGEFTVGLTDSPRRARAGASHASVPEPSSLLLLLPTALLALRLKPSAPQVC